MSHDILLSNGFVSVPEMNAEADPARLGTVLSNLAYYGYVPGRDAYERLMKLDDVALANW